MFSYNGDRTKSCETFCRRSAHCVLFTSSPDRPTVYIPRVTGHTEPETDTDRPFTNTRRNVTQHEVGYYCDSVARSGGHSGRRRQVGARKARRHRVEEQQRTVRVRGRVVNGQEADRLRQPGAAHAELHLGRSAAETFDCPRSQDPVGKVL